MNKISKRKIFIASVSALVAFGGGISLATSNTLIKSEAEYSPGTTYTHGDGDTYYNGISDSLTGTNLLNALRNLNSSKRKKTVGYSAMSTSIGSSAYIYTDYDPNYATTNNGVTKGTRVLSFYSGTSITNWNREHTWPNSHGGNLIEADIHMTRPTITSENGSRGNSFYVEGMKHSSNGWDPAMESFGVESYRGDSARIIFYGAVANSALSIVDLSYHATSNANRDNMMGKLSDLLKWNLQYSVQQRERNRNEGAQYLQGNRNPFIDNPEYACKIWGDTNTTTQNICASFAPEVPNTITVTPSTESIEIGETVTLNVTVDSGSSEVTWSSNNTAVATVSNGVVTGVDAGTATITATSTLDTSVKGTATITVKSLSTLSLSGTATNKSYSAGQSFNPAGLTITATYSDSSTANVTSSVVWTPDPLTEGTTSVTGTYGGKTVSVSGLTVTAPVGYTLVTSASQLTSGDSLIFAHTSSSSTAGALDGTFLNPVTNATFSSDTITDAGSSLIFTLGGSSNNWTFTNNGQTLKSSAAKNVNFNSGTATWSISVASGGDATVTNTTSSYGSLQYNTGAPRFTTYTSSQAAIQLYRQGGGQSSVAVTGVSLNTNSLNLVVGNNSTLTATVAPTNATNKNVTWSSSDTSVATVSSTGVISALAAGSATITVNTLDGGFTDTCALTVVAPLPEIILVTGVTLNKSTLPLQVEVSEILIATVNPSDATNKDVTWSSSDTSVVSVSDGVVTALKAGTAVITVTTVDGGFFDTCEVEVNEVDEPIDPQNPPDQSSNEGCGGSIAITSMVIAGFSVVGFIFVILKKRFSK